MKLAIEHLQHTIAALERSLTESKNALKAAQRQLDEHAAAVDLSTRKITDLNAALAALRTPTASAPPQILKTEFAERPRQTLSRKN